MKKKYKKGEFSYLGHKKKLELIKTLLMFGISALVFILGLISTKTKSNYLTIVAVLGCLPASKSAVSTIMYYRIKECSRELFCNISEKFPNMGSFHLYFTSYDKNFATSHIFVKASTIIAYTENHKTDANAFEEHISTVLKHDGLKNCHIKLFTDKDKYLQRIEQLMILEANQETDNRIMKVLHSVSL